MPGSSKQAPAELARPFGACNAPSGIHGSACQPLRRIQRCVNLNSLNEAIDGISPLFAPVGESGECLAAVFECSLIDRAISFEYRLCCNRGQAKRRTVDCAMANDSVTLGVEIVGAMSSWDHGIRLI